MKSPLLKEEQQHQESWREGQRKGIIWRYTLSGNSLGILCVSAVGGPTKSPDLFHRWNKDCKCMQIQSGTVTNWGNLREEHEITFYFSHPATKAAWQPRDKFKGPHGLQCREHPQNPTQYRIWEWGEVTKISTLTSSFICDTIVTGVFLLF